jgi:uncharacterized membrane protein YqhA
MAESKKSGHQRMGMIVGVTRFAAYLPVIALLASALALLLLGCYETITTIVRLASRGISQKEALVDFISVADLFLLSTVIYIMALGLFQLFIEPHIALPAWLVVSDLDDLKEKLTSVVIVVLGVLFLGFVVKSPGQLVDLWEGLGIGVVVLSLSAFLYVFNRHRAEASSRAKAFARSRADAEVHDAAESESGALPRRARKRRPAHRGSRPTTEQS